MANRLQWMLELQDRLSSPGARIQNQLGRISAQMKVLNAQSRATSIGPVANPLKYQQALLGAQRAQLLLQKSQLGLDQANEKSGGGWKQNLRTMRDVLFVARLLKDVFNGLTNAVRGSMHAVIDPVSFKQSSLIGLNTFLGKAGGSTFEGLTALAGQTGKPIDKIVGMGQSFAAAGVKPRDVTPMVRIVQDFDAMSPGGGDKLAGILSGVYSTGFLSTGDVEGLRGTGLRPEKIFEQIDKMLGGKGDRFGGKKRLEGLNAAGTGILPNNAAQLLLGQVLALEGGRMGSASGRAGATLEARIANIGTQMERMFSRLSNSPGMKAFNGVLKNIGDLLNPDSAAGKRTLAMLTQISEGFGKILGPLTGADGKKRMEDFFERWIGFMERLKPLVGYVASNIRDAVGDIEAFSKTYFPTESEKQRTPARTAALEKQLDDQLGTPNDAARKFFARLFDRAPAPPEKSAPAVASNVTIPVKVTIDANVGRSDKEVERISNLAAQAVKKEIISSLRNAATHAGGQSE